VVVVVLVDHLLKNISVEVEVEVAKSYRLTT
jgi:hypothetical protein